MWANRLNDGFNWGYDPYHYGVPEGSYASNPDGVQRIVEFRDMVSALNQNGLRVVMDVVYNHTAAGRPGRQVGAGQGGARLLLPLQHGRRDVQLVLLRRHGRRVRHDGEADDRHGDPLCRGLQGGQLPLRPDEPAHPAQHGEPQGGRAGIDRGRQRRGRQQDLPLRRGLGLWLGRGQGADHLPRLLRQAVQHDRHWHRHLQRPDPRCGPRRLHRGLAGNPQAGLHQRPELRLERLLLR